MRQSIITGMTWEQKLVAIQALGEIVIGMRSPGDWYVYPKNAEIKDQSVLKSCKGDGRTPMDAADDCWKGLTTDLKPREVVVIDAYGDKRRLVKWNGFMWADVPEEAPAASHHPRGG